MAKKSEYALYKGDELIVVGTAQEIADFRGVQLNSIYRLKTPSRLKCRKSRKHREGFNYYELIKLED